MPDNARYYTPAEAGAISGLGRKAIDNAIDKRLIPVLGKGKAARAIKPHRSKTWHRRLISESEVVWIYLNHAAGGAIPREDRDDLFKRYLHNLKARELRVSHLVILDLESARERILERAAKLERAKANVVSDPEVLGGEPVIRDTRVPVYDVAASVRKGISVARLREAYSVLDEDAIEDAVLYAEAFPPRGRPRSRARFHPALVPIEEKVVRRKPTG